ncbi:hypothetical protein B0I35DRAFT_250351 [Stachybotrys elegans]|uniref:Ribonucleases P/MRP subunit Pop8-like domain-containing protein n=1 Tax=Stachybotrys elegans TaxID=80388 RepID=A0A8K0SPM3_9HYPO|nr:hypothetical protein B0I35DRAFT_250351 [Stachybotrys elegans]
MSQSQDTSQASLVGKTGLQKSHDLLTCTARAPQFAYIHMELVTDDGGAAELDNIQVMSYCTAALRQFLGLTGMAIPLDILKAEGADCWVRVPAPDLGSVAAAVTAWKGTVDGDGRACLLRVKQCSDWLGTMVGGDGLDRLWDS